MDIIFDFVLNHFKVIELIVFWYPITMGLLWVVGGIIYYFRIERKEPLPLPSTPMVSVLVPAYNESDNLVDVVQHLNELNYPNYEILIINDGSKDDTAKYATSLANKYERVRFVDLQENCGKANALYLGYLASKGEYLVCVDGDSYLDKDCLRYLMSHFLNPHNGERVGAVTGNPRVRNRSSLFAKIQLCEYASIISLIKRTQRIWGKVMTVSGVVVAYRKAALMDCGLWDRDMITEDIGVTWKLERNFWDIRYEPNALCWMLVPETLKGLVKQRKRWAQGGQEVIMRHAGIFKSWRRKRMYPIYIEQVMSTLWVVLWLLLTLTEIFKLCFGIGSYMPYLWKSQYLSVICMVQFIVALKLEKRYDKTIFKYMLVAAWYPIVYWIISGLVALAAIPSTIKSRTINLARWNSPDRGIGTDTQKLVVAVTESGTNDETDGIVIPDRKTSEDESPIIDGKQVLWKRIIEIVFTCVAWAFILVYFAYCIYGYGCLVLGKTPISIWIYNTEMLMETKRLLFVTLIILLVEIVIMIFWKEYNRIRFGRLNRRKFMPDVTTEQVAEFFDLPESTVSGMQELKILTLTRNGIPDDFKAERKFFLSEKTEANRKTDRNTNKKQL
ncbi:MAG: poly-beta-1,6-N-acetyl-D-glucosamine synthase [Lachnospiraceae bacterium]|nr:poly-beta-1,6-N-acetyl-D-glucosamine synthase [Lachnospiraceae bacterium]